MLDLANGWNLQWEISRTVTTGSLPLFESPVFQGSNIVLSTTNPQQPTWKYAGTCYQKAIFDGQELTVSARKLYLGQQLLVLPAVVQGFFLVLDFARWHQAIEIKAWSQ